MRVLFNLRCVSSLTPTYAIVERTHADYSNNAIGEQEWRRACRQAGISPAEVGA